jgi:hypothetical protein
MNDAIPDGMREEFSVWVFFPDGTRFAEVGRCIGFIG